MTSMEEELLLAGVSQISISICKQAEWHCRKAQQLQRLKMTQKLKNVPVSGADSLRARLEHPLYWSSGAGTYDALAKGRRRCNMRAALEDKCC